ncbi:MAG TPA: hypothetical protein VLG38_04050, partial [Gammaproteobacteria bacterium]|nr:hypothetical protein [Gammaproteobacteria bacterium]
KYLPDVSELPRIPDSSQHKPPTLPPHTVKSTPDPTVQHIGTKAPVPHTKAPVQKRTKAPHGTVHKRTRAPVRTGAPVMHGFTKRPTPKQNPPTTPKTEYETAMPTRYPTIPQATTMPTRYPIAAPPTGTSIAVVDNIAGNLQVPTKDQLSAQDFSTEYNNAQAGVANLLTNFRWLDANTNVNSAIKAFLRPTGGKLPYPSLRAAIGAHDTVAMFGPVITNYLLDLTVLKSKAFDPNNNNDFTPEFSALIESLHGDPDTRGLADLLVYSVKYSPALDELISFTGNLQSLIKDAIREQWDAMNLIAKFSRKRYLRDPET